jgi:hypothetical protein
MFISNYFLIPQRGKYNFTTLKSKEVGFSGDLSPLAVSSDTARIPIERA